MKLNQQSLGVVWVLSALQLVSSVSGNSEHVYKFCENISASNITTHAILINNDFPNSSQSRNCSCTLMSHKSPMQVLPAYLTMSGNSATTSNTSTTLKMTVDGTRTYRQTVDNFSWMYEMFTRPNHTIQTLEIEMEPRENTRLTFAFSVRPEKEDGSIDIRCMTSPIENNDVTDVKVDDWTGKLANPTLVFFLGGICIVLLLMLLLVAVILCCVMPRKQKRQMKKIRNSMMLLDNDVPNLQNNRPLSHTYSNSNAENFRVPPNSNRSTSVSQNFPNQHYSNTQRESTIYQNT